MGFVINWLVYSTAICVTLLFLLVTHLLPFEVLFGSPFCCFSSQIPDHWNYRLCILKKFSQDEKKSFFMSLPSSKLIISFISINNCLCLLYDCDLAKNHLISFMNLTFRNHHYVIHEEFPITLLVKLGFFLLTCNNIIDWKNYHTTISMGIFVGPATKIESSYLLSLCSYSIFVPL